MSNSVVTVDLQGGAGATTGAASKRLVLEAYEESTTPFNAADIGNMFNIARTGYSARTYKANDCSVKVGPTSVKFKLFFYAWAYPSTLSYSLTSNLGKVSEGTVIEEERHEDVTFEQNDTVAIDGEVSRLEYEWITPLFNRFGVEYPQQPISLVDGALTIPESLFGVADVAFIKTGYLHHVEVEIDTEDANGDPIIVSNIHIIVTGSFTNDAGEAEIVELTLPIPQCVEDAFNLCSGKPSLICHDCEAEVVEVWYNTCTGKIVDVRKRDLYESQDKWCLPA